MSKRWTEGQWSKVELGYQNLGFTTEDESNYSDTVSMKATDRTVDYYNLCREMQDVTSDRHRDDSGTKIDRFPTSNKYRSTSEGNKVDKAIPCKQQSDRTLEEKTEIDKYKTEDEKKATLLQMAKDCKNLEEVKSWYTPTYIQHK